jgi:hypothetical protein
MSGSAAFALWLVGLALVPGAAHARLGAIRSAPSPASAGRELLQTAVDCDRAVSNCQECMFVRAGPGVSRALCTRCSWGYVSRQNGFACCEQPHGAARRGISRAARLRCVHAPHSRPAPPMAPWPQTQRTHTS